MCIRDRDQGQRGRRCSAATAPVAPYPTSVTYIRVAVYPASVPVPDMAYHDILSQYHTNA
eukprot:1947283-Rhodomonas_salina.1